MPGPEKWPNNVLSKGGTIKPFDPKTRETITAATLAVSDVREDGRHSIALDVPQGHRQDAAGNLPGAVPRPHPDLPGEAVRLLLLD
jgi:hypothetical protein